MLHSVLSIRTTSSHNSKLLLHTLPVQSDGRASAVPRCAGIFLDPYRSIWLYVLSIIDRIGLIGLSPVPHTALSIGHRQVLATAPASTDQGRGAAD
jgi:hypothetical protein